MEFLLCDTSRFEETAAFYARVVRHLEETVNYPKWTDDHPGREYVSQAVRNKEQYICTDGGRVVGAVILSEDPEGYYEAGDWNRELRRGEFLTVHALAAEPESARS
ncbi:MAG: hypothetical protein IJ639_10945, partial [Ruminococcus sp.]|nr:hypothetical protein [Ruminococcus sp.]